MTRLINCFRDKKGSSFPLIVAITLALVIIMCGILEFFRLNIIASGVKEAVQDAIIITVNDNYANVYHGVREGYSGGYYLPDDSSFSYSVDTGDVYGHMDSTLGTTIESGKHIKYSGDVLEYKLSGLEVMPIGYKMVDGKIQIDKTKEKVVKKVFKDYLSGVSTYGLAKELTAMGFLNANNKPSWNHGSIGKILENIKYLGDDLYPQMIEVEQFEQVQNLRKERCQTLGRNAQPNSMVNQYAFSSKLRCGECGDIYRKYVEHSGKPSERTNWKCKKYIYKNRVYCRCGVITDEQIKEAFVSTANHIISKMYILDRKPKAASPPVSLKFKKLDQRVKELEADGRYSSKELSDLIFKRAMAFYNTAEIKDYEHTTEKMKQVFFQREQLKEFDDDLFSTVVKHLTVYVDRRLTFEFINGLTIDGTY